MQRIEAPREVEEDDSTSLHQSQMVPVEDCSFSDPEFHIFTVQPCALELEAVLNLGVLIDYTHWLLALRALAGLWQDTLVDHPAEAALEALGNSIYLHISHEAFFDEISLDRIVLVYSDLKVAQSCLAKADVKRLLACLSHCLLSLGWLLFTHTAVTQEVVSDLSWIAHRLDCLLARDVVIVVIS